MIKGIQIVGILVGLYLLLSTLNNYRKGESNIERTAFWGLVWSVMTIFFANTQIVTIIMPILSTEDAIMTVMVLGILVSFLFINQVYMRVIDLDKKITTLSQNIAINDFVYRKNEKEQ